MAFLIRCPNCGNRNVSEFRFGGERMMRPEPEATEDKWAQYFYNRTNAKGIQNEWWYHRFGCKKWFVADRDTMSNNISRTAWAKLT